jgi:two-component system chemotaxis response regulator CheV
MTAIPKDKFKESSKNSFNQSQSILLESGTNEIEVFEFFLGQQSFGINALKISELNRLEDHKIVPIPNTHPCMLGTVIIREKLVPVVDLKKYLELPTSSADEKLSKKAILFCDFNKKIVGFIVDQISGIHRLFWNNIQPPPILLMGNTQITGIALVGNKEVALLDFEQITEDVLKNQNENNSGSLKLINTESSLLKSMGLSRDQFKILACDDTPIIRKKLQTILAEQGFKDIKIFNNGSDLFDDVSLQFQTSPDRQIKQTLVITDIEMPIMDGLTLCKKLKTLDQNIPVIVMSSMINDQISAKCREVNANESVSKSDFDQIIPLIDKLLASL